MALKLVSVCYVCDAVSNGLFRRDSWVEYLEDGTELRGSNGLICESCYESKAI